MKSLLQIKALLRKNYLIQKNSPFCTVLEIFLSIIFCFILLVPSHEGGEVSIGTFEAYEVSGREVYIEPEPPEYSSFGFYGWRRRRRTPTPYHLEYEKIYFTPNTLKNRKLMNRVVDRLTDKSNNEWWKKQRIEQSKMTQLKNFSAEGFSDEEAMVDKLLVEHSKCNSRETYKCKFLMGGVIIHSNLDNNNLNYTIRMPNIKKDSGQSIDGFRRRSFSDLSVQSSSWNTNLDFETMDDGYITDDRSSYWYSGFLALQRAIDMSWIESHASENQLKQLQDLNFYTQRMAEKKTKPKGEVGRSFVLFALFYIYWISAIMTGRMVGNEKEDGMKEYMKAIGLNNWIQWLTNFLYSFIKLTAMCVILTVCLSVIGNGFGKSDISLVFFFLFVYSISVNCWAFAMAASFNSTVRIVLTIAILHFLLSVISASLSISNDMFDDMNYVPWSTVGNMLPMLVNNFALSQGVKLMVFYEEKGIGMKWENFLQPPRPYDTLTMGLIILMLCIDSVICLVYAWYVDAVAPGPMGLPQKPWFFIQKSYWTGIPPKEQVKFKEEGEANMDDINLTTVEPMSPLKTPSIILNDVVKVYDNGKFIALNQFSLSIYPDQITSVLGHNGAGKSTAMKIMTGILPVSSGTVHIGGSEFTATSMQTIREKMGFCPQENILFPMLTVEQHLQIFYRLKKGELDQSEVDRVMLALGFGNDRNTKSEYLSGGGKRKLLVGMALIGGSELVFLDEPSSGMDPATRQMMWQFIKGEKANRTIVLITHFMEEADILGDRIAIMAAGQLQCIGSGLFLKKHYGIGYNLKVSFDREAGTDSSKLMDVIVKYCPDATLESEWDNEVTVVLPQQYGPCFSFPDLFQEIEENGKRLKISSFGVAITTLEDVFLRVVKKMELEEEKDPLIEIDDDADEKLFDYHESFSVPEVQLGSQLQNQQFRGMLMKKFQLAKRNFGLCVLQLLLPALCVLLAVAMTRANEIFGWFTPDSKTSDMPPLKFSMAPFSHSAVLWQKNTATGIGAALSYKYKDYILKQDHTIRNISYIDPDRYMLSQYEEHAQYDIERLFIIGGLFESDHKVVAYFQGIAQHSVAIATTFLDNVILQYVVNNSKASITTINHPLPKDIWATSYFDAGESGNTQNEAKTLKDVFLPTNLFLVFGLACASSSFTVQYGDEASSLTKHLQLLTGTHLSIYWAAHVLFDASISLAGSFLAVLFMVLLNVRQFDELWGTLLSMVCLFSMGTVTRGCFLTRVSTSRVYLFIINFVIAMGLDGFLLGYSFVNMDNYILGGTDCLVQNCSYQNATETPEPEPSTIGFPFDNGFIVGAMIFFGIQIVVYSFGLTGDERLCYNKETYGKDDLQNLREPAEPVPDDNDVVDEAEVVSEITGGQNIPLFTRKLHKVYNGHKIVNNFNIKLSAGDCLGLLGLNGAGKSTIFQMLVGLENISFGEAQIFGFDVERQWKWAGSNFGFCPQKEAMSESLSGYESLCLFARLRGIPEQQVAQVVTAVIKAVKIEKHAHKPAYTYSGGLKRRLSFGMSVIGLPQVLLLDEPTTGVDPAAKRRVWHIMQELRLHGLTAVLTSHSMDECEVLCSRIALMVRGRLACLGTSQHLKEKFGAGCTLQVKILAEEYLEYAQTEIEEAFGNIELKEQHELILTYSIPPSPEWPYSRMFRVMEDLVVPLKIADYSLCQTSLDQVFMHFAHDSSVYYKKLNIDHRADMLIIEAIW